VGRPLDLGEGVARGIDMFDCVIATRHARSGTLYTTQGRMRITDQRYRSDMYPIDKACTCYTCTGFTRAYLNHLFRVGEVLASALCTIHNLAFFADFMARMRQSVLDGSFDAFRAEVHRVWPEATGPAPVAGGGGGAAAPPPRAPPPLISRGRPARAAGPAPRPAGPPRRRARRCGRAARGAAAAARGPARAAR